MKRRWKNLRTAYTRSLKAIRKWQVSKSGDSAKQKKAPRPYKYAAEMDFLNPVLAVEITTDNLSEEQDSPPQDSDNEPSEEVWLYITLLVFI